MTDPSEVLGANNMLHSLPSICSHIHVRVHTHAHTYTHALLTQKRHPSSAALLRRTVFFFSHLPESICQSHPLTNGAASTGTHTLKKKKKRTCTVFLIEGESERSLASFLGHFFHGSDGFSVKDFCFSWEERKALKAEKTNMVWCGKMVHIIYI